MIHVRGKRSKYSNKKVEIDGFKFDSKKEAQHYWYLSNLQKLGEINNLQVHPKYEIIVNGKKICSYTPDFEYTTEAGEKIVCDVKSEPTKTPVYRLKTKLMLAVHGINIIEV